MKIGLRGMPPTKTHTILTVEGDGAGAADIGSGGGEAAAPDNIITGGAGDQQGADGAGNGDAAGAGGDAGSGDGKDGDGAAGAGTDGAGGAGDRAAAGDDGAGKDGADGAASGAPDKYEFAVPEGMTVDQAGIAEFEPTFKELGLTQENAQKLVTQYAGYVQKAADAQAQATLAAATELRTNWARETASDATVGGTPERLAENRTIMAKALDSYGSPELRTLLNETGLTNNVHMAKFFLRVGAQLGEAPVLDGGAGARAPTSLEAKMYDPAFLPPDQRR